MDERQRLIEELEKILWDDENINRDAWIDNLANFILEDRKRIVAPLKEIYPKLERNVNDEICFMCLDAINDTLKLAGASHGE